MKKEEEMYKIEKKDFGYKLLFSGMVSKDEMANWVKDAEKALATQSGPFGVFVDMRDLKPLSNDAKVEMENGQKAFKGKGMQRSVVILNSAIVTMQFKKIAKETGIYEWERYIDASSTPDWEAKGIDWLKNGVNPE